MVAEEGIESRENGHVRDIARSVTLKDRVIGCLLGGALGNAWGGPWEGKAGPVPFEIPTRPVFSDDTQFTLATCESIIDKRGVDPENLASHFVHWFRARRIRGMGSSTLKAMRDLAAGTHWALAGARGEFAAGSGAAMRVAPLAFVLDPLDAQDRVKIRDVCRITHHNDEAYVGALAVLLAMRSVITGTWSQERGFLAAAFGGLPDSAVRDRIHELLALQVSPSEIGHDFGASGHVVDTVPLALYCAQSIACESLEMVLTRTIAVGGDTDTIGSITGQLAGAAVGLGGVPEALVAHIESSEELVSIAYQFADFVQSRNANRSA